VTATLQSFLAAPGTLHRVYRKRAELHQHVSNPWKLSWQMLKSREATCEAVLPGGRAFRFRNSRGDMFVFEEVFLRGLYADALRHVRFPVDTIVDIGANIGAFSVFVGDRAKHLVAVEPDPACEKLLRYNLQQNGFEAKTTVVPAAVGSRGGRATLLCSRSQAACNSLKGASPVAPPLDASTVDVEVLPLESIFERGGVARCSLLKLDCEGSEYDILTEPNRKALERVDALVCEVHRRSSNDSGYRTIVGSLRSFGFTVHETLAESEIERIALRTPLGEGFVLLSATRQR
jgi:FkbM family methyltransferase